MSKRIFIGLGIICIYLFVTALAGNMAIKLFVVSEGIASMVGMSISLGCILLLLKWQKIQLIHWKNLTVINSLKAIGIGFGVTFVSNAILLRLFPNMELRNQNAVNEMIGTAPIVLMFVLVAIVGPILEEIVFRGVFMKLFFQKHQLVGALISSALFALAHYGTTPLEFITYFIPGIIFGFLAYRYKGIEYAVVYHIFMNSLAFMLMILNLQ